MDIDAVQARSEDPGLVNVLIDTPRGSANKFKYDEKLGVYRLSRILPAGMHFPYDFGSIPRTRAEDGDALDVLVLMESPTFPGCLVTARLIGAIRATQREKKQRKAIRNDRLIAVPQTPANRSSIRSVDELSAEQISEIEHFFISYNQAHGREFKPTGRPGPQVAERLVDQAIRAYERQG